MRCCCAWCCCCSCRSGKGKGRLGAQPKYVTARWLTCLKVLSALVLGALAGGCALGMARMDKYLVGSGIKTMSDVQVGEPWGGGGRLGEQGVASKLTQALGAASGRQPKRLAQPMLNSDYAEQSV